MAEKVFLIDMGHGGLIHDLYQTAPKKMYRHTNGEVAYEGVINRQVGGRVIEGMTDKQLQVVNICPTELDLPLDLRVDIVNAYCKEYGNSNCLLISLHCNAGKGDGFEIWTSVGQTASDRYADEFCTHYEQAFPKSRIRTDRQDGDVDKESQFYILKNTRCPAILPEWLFFDNYDNYKIQKDPKMQQKYADAIVTFAQHVQFINL
jgi:N-acetylmuramoyl-L-alanine amidase